jgi:hypothetical protein
MITPAEVYWILQADNFCDVFFFLGGLGILILFGGFLFLTNFWCKTESKEEEEKYERKAKKFFKWMIPTVLFIWVIYFFMPDTKTLSLMYLVPKVANAELTQKIPDYLEKFIQKELKTFDMEKNDK